MKSLRLILFAVFTSGTLALFPLSAQAVQSQSLPAGDVMYAIDCNVSESLILRLVNTSDASWNDVNSAPYQQIEHSTCGYQPAFNPLTGKSYYLAGNNENNTWPLVEISTSGGAFALIHDIQESGISINTGVSYPGNLLINSAGDAYYIGSNRLYPLNLSDGSIGTVVNNNALDVNGDIYAAACSPVNEKCYVLTNLGYLYELNLSNGTVGSALGQLPYVGNYSLQVDSLGTLWSSSNFGKLASFSASDPSGTYWEYGRFPEYSGALLITAGPAPLPDTGVDVVTPVIAAAITLGAGSAVFIFAAYRRRSA